MLGIDSALRDPCHRRALARPAALGPRPRPVLVQGEVLRPQDHDRWLGIEPDPRDLLRPFPAEAMRMWPISTRVNSPKNDDPDLLTPVSPDSSNTPAQAPNSL